MDSMELDRRSALAALGLAGAGALIQPSMADAGTFALRSLSSTLTKYGGRTPTYWGMAAPGVRRRFPTSTTLGYNAICLTFDACGGSVTRYDSTLIYYLRKYQVPATLFINRRWAMNNLSIFKNLAADPLFEIQNHGYTHQPLSVNGKYAYGIKGTSSLTGVWYEIASAHRYFVENNWAKTKFMRPGTCYTDDVAAAAAVYMGQRIVNFSINGDAGATYTASQVYSAVLKARPGDIVLAHMNRPGSGTAVGIARAIPAMRARGIRFRRLSQVLT